MKFLSFTFLNVAPPKGGVSPCFKEYGDPCLRRGDVLFCVLALFFLPMAAHAASCYTPAQFRAEQVVRLQTQLMMTSLLCPSAVPGVPSAYSAYMQFSQRHKNFIAAQENTLLAFYRAQRVPQPDRHLHTFKTNMANRLATFAANRAPGVFCRSYGARLQQAVRLTPVALQNWGNQIALNRPSTYPACGATK